MFSFPPVAVGSFYSTAPIPLTGKCSRVLQSVFRQVNRRQQSHNFSQLKQSFRQSLIAHGVAFREVDLPKQSQRTQNTFQDIGILPELQNALAELNITTPTEIQECSLPAVREGGDILLASHTGSGKTLAYFLPLVEHLKRSEQRKGTESRSKRPRALILGPTRELTDQILRVGKALSHHAKFRSACVNGGGSWTIQKEALEKPLDIVVGTPMRVLQHAQKGNMYFGDVEFVVLDEADTMFDSGFGPEVRGVLEAVRNKPQPARCILVAATVSKQIRKLLDDVFPSIRRVETRSLHKGVGGAAHSFVPLPMGANKMDLLKQVINREVQSGKRLMVFCNTIGSCRALEHHLSENELPTVCYHGDVPLEDRKQAMKTFGEGDANDQAVMVCTDLAARGLDIPGRVDHVVNFDFPLNPIDYIHRSGRTARAGSKGRITSLVAKPDKVLAARIEQALQAGLPLDELSANKRVLPPNMRPKAETIKRRTAERKAEAAARKGRRGAARTAPSKAAGTSRTAGASAKGSGKKAAPSSGGTPGGVTGGFGKLGRTGRVGAPAARTGRVGAPVGVPAGTSRRTRKPTGKRFTKFK